MERFDGENRKGEGVFFSPKGKGTTDYGNVKTEKVIQPKNTFTSSDQETAVYKLFGKDEGRRILEKYDELASESQTGLEAFGYLDDLIGKELSKQGYDSVHYLADRGMAGIDQLSGENWHILDKNIIKTKSQLVDIWKKANGK